MDKDKTKSFPLSNSQVIIDVTKYIYSITTIQ